MNAPRTWDIGRSRRPGHAHLLAGVALLLWLFLVVACGTGTPPADSDAASQVLGLETLPPGTCGLNLNADSEGELGDDHNDEAQIRALIAAEGRLMAAREIAPLMALWAEESQVVNAKHTPDDPSDNQVWRGKDAIRHRYLNVVFPSAPTSMQTANLDLNLEGDRAVALGTTHFNGELSPNGDRWVVRRDSVGCWLIEELTYNLEPLNPAP